MVSCEISSIFQTVIIGSVIFVLYKIVEYVIFARRIEKEFAGIPGPTKKHWLFGSMYEFPKSGSERVEHFINLAHEYGEERGYFLLWSAFKTPVLVPCSPEIMGKICKSSEPKSTGLIGLYRLIRPWLGDGLLVANGERWARNRRLLTPAFHFDILKPYMTEYNGCTNSLIAKLNRHADGGERFELFQNISLCTLEIILKCAFSYNKDVQNEGRDSLYVQSVKRITDSLQIRLGSPLLLFDVLWNLSKRGRQFNTDCKYAHSVTEEIIDNRRKVLEQSDVKNTRKHLDFLDILLTARDEKGEGLTDLEIRNEADTFLFEGHDTTASSISWILFSLADNPECQRKCQAEIDEVLSQRDGEDIQWTDLPKFEYLTMCIKEGMRMHSPVPIVNRMTTNEFDVGDRVLPKGILVQINILVMNHMEKYWPNHRAFIPERFSKENSAKLVPFQYVPFSAGSRNCIGQNFAMNEEKVVLAKLLRNFNFTLDTSHDVKKTLSAVMRAEDGIYMFVERRTVRT